MRLHSPEHYILVKFLKSGRELGLETAVLGPPFFSDRGWHHINNISPAGCVTR